MISNIQVIKVIIFSFIVGVIVMAVMNGNITKEQFRFENRLSGEISNSFKEYRKGTSLEGR